MAGELFFSDINMLEHEVDDHLSNYPRFHDFILFHVIEYSI